MADAQNSVQTSIPVRCPLANATSRMGNGLDVCRSRKVGEADNRGGLDKTHGCRAKGEWIVIKGVMDPADPNKADRFKLFASRASAEALRSFHLAEDAGLLTGSNPPCPTADLRRIAHCSGTDNPQCRPQVPPSARCLQYRVTSAHQGHRHSLQ